jgi:sorbitol-specific phosphotransferase system component IIBC
MQPHVHSHHGGNGGALRVSAQATLHCLTGCVIGEVAGLLIGVTLGLAVWQTIALATLLAYATGMTLGLVPVMRSRGIGIGAAFRIIWLGEVVSIGVMELVMNQVDYQMGGMTAPSVLSWMFWRGILFAIPAGFLAAWPVNYWLIRRDLKACH